MKPVFYIFGMLCIYLLLWGTEATAQETLPQDRSAAVIFAYHRVGEDRFPNMNIRTEQFSAHIRELKDSTYNVMSLPDIVDALRSGATLPERTVALTFDGGYTSTLQNAVPEMLDAGIPFTLFVSTDYLSRDSSEYISWSNLKKLTKNKLVTIGLHPASYTHLAGAPAEDLRRHINNARSQMRERLGIEPVLFAYPFGEYSTIFRDAVSDSGFTAAFGQQSGVAYAQQDRLAMPRFPMTESYGDLDRFRMAAAALPLPLNDVQPQNPRIESTDPMIGFTVDTALQNTLGKISCFASGQEQPPKLEHIGNGRMELRLVDTLEEEKVRINCTMPGPPDITDEQPRWRWFGMLMTVAAIH